MAENAGVYKRYDTSYAASHKHEELDLRWFNLKVLKYFLYLL